MQAAKNIVWRRVGDDSLVLLDLETGRYNSLNRSASIIWGAAVRGASIPDCAQQLVQHYPSLAIDEANRAATSLLESLKQRGICTEGEPETAGLGAGLDFEKGGEFQAPTLEEHEALQEVTAGTYSGYSGGYSYTYYYYYTY